MTISSSLNASVAGLFANATKLATISDNIANSSTYGYKRVVADFQSIVIGEGGSSYSAGGVRAGTQRLIDEAGSLATTNNATDLAVRGRGMLPVSPLSSIMGGGAAPMLLTTTGSFRTDEQGYLTSNSGLVLMGWPANSDGTIPTYPRDTADGLSPIRLSTAQYPGEPTTFIDLAVNLPATGTSAGAPGTAEELSVEYIDNLRKPQSLSVTFTPTVPATGQSNTWNLTLTDGASGGAVVGDYTLVFDDTRGAGGTLLSVTDNLGTAPYDAATGDLDITVDGGPMTINIGTLGSPVGLTQLADSFTPGSIEKNGTPVGNMISVEVDENGFVRASFDTGATQIIYQVPLIDVQNINGMKALDRQTYEITPKAGNFFLWDAGDGPTGEVVSYAREESTTDVAAELTQLIRTQRAYSSNAKVIQTVDEMLQETTNIKR